MQVANLLGHAGEGHVQLQAHPTARGKLATGITFTAFTGMAVLTGITLTGVGCARSGPRMCKGGLITLAVSAPLLAGSIWLILDSRARAEVVPHDGGPVLMAKPTGRACSGARASSRARSSPAQRDLAMTSCE